MVRKILQQPFGLLIISGISFVNGFMILLMLRNHKIYLVSAGITICLLFIISGFFLLKHKNFARILSVMLFISGILINIIYFDAEALQVASILFSLIIIGYLLSKRISGLFLG